MALVARRRPGGGVDRTDGPRPLRRSRDRAPQNDRGGVGPAAVPRGKAGGRGTSVGQAEGRPADAENREPTTDRRRSSGGHAAAPAAGRPALGGRRSGRAGRRSAGERSRNGTGRGDNARRRGLRGRERAERSGRLRHHDQQLDREPHRHQYLRLPGRRGHLARRHDGLCDRRIVQPWWDADVHRHGQRHRDGQCGPAPRPDRAHRGHPRRVHGLCAGARVVDAGRSVDPDRRRGHHHQRRRRRPRPGHHPERYHGLHTHLDHGSLYLPEHVLRRGAAREPGHGDGGPVDRRSQLRRHVARRVPRAALGGRRRDAQRSHGLRRPQRRRHLGLGVRRPHRYLHWRRGRGAWRSAIRRRRS